MNEINQQPLRDRPHTMRGLIPAITYDCGNKPISQTASGHPKREVIFVDGHDALVMKSADDIEKAAWQEAEAMCEGGMKPAICYVEGKSEMDRGIIAAANELPAKYQQKYQLPIPPVLYPNPNSFSADLENVVAATPKQHEQREGVGGANQNGHLGTYVYTDLELAQLLMQRVWIKRRGQQVYRFNGAFYQPLTENGLRSTIMACLRAELNVSGKSNRIRAVADAILAEPEIEVKEQEINRSKICVLDGLLDTVTGQLSPHTPGYFIDWQLNASWSGNYSCPIFDRYLETVTGGDPILLSRFWQATGYLLVGDGNIAKRVFVLTGPSDTGKSVYGSLLRGFFHPEQVASVDAFQMGERFAASALEGARLNLAMDLPYGLLPEQAVGMIKSISGSDAVTVEIKFRTPYAVKLNCKLVFATNHPVRAAVPDKALARRLMFLPFRNPIPRSQQDPYLLDHLLTERTAILRRAVQAYCSLRASNYVFAGDDLFHNEALMGIADDSSEPVDMVEQFVNTCCAGAPEQFISTEQVYGAYRTFCQRAGTRYPDSCQLFSAQIFPVLAAKYQAMRGKRRVEGVPRNGYIGVRLCNADTNGEDE